MARTTGGSPLVLVVLIFTVGSFMAAHATRVGKMNRARIWGLSVKDGVMGRSKAAAAEGLCETIVAPWGYPCDEYTVQTDDGFLLGVQNIPHGINGPNAQPGKPVFLQHGLFAGGDNWLFNDPSESLGYILADAEYDVWIGNIRGIDWSHGHISLTPSDDAFWSWTWDDLAAFDLPAMLQFVNQQTGSEIFYVGHSQGTSMLLGGLSATPKAAEMATILSGAALLCPIAYMESITSGLDKAASDLYFDKIFQIFGIAEFDINNELGKELLDQVCNIPIIDCASILSTVIRSGVFQKYDYGSPTANQAAYGEVTPPVYNLTNLPDSVPILILHGGQDQLADPADVATLVAQLGSRLANAVNLPDYAHIDFVTSVSANVDVYPYITDFFQSLT